MSIVVECDCGKEIRVADDAGGKRVRCPECHALVRVPVSKVESDVEVLEDEPAKPKATPGKARKAAIAVDEEEAEEPRERKKRPVVKKRKRRRDDDDEPTSPFWRSRAGLILNGLGLIGLGLGGIGFYWFDNRHETGLLIAGILCIGFGIGGVITGLTKPSAASRSRHRDEEDE
jgi:hypothetical protein